MELLIAFLVIIGVIILIIVLCIMFSRKCEACGKYRAMIEVDRVEVGQVQTTVKEKREEKDKDGKVIRSWYVDLPATKTEYIVTRKCKYCEHKDRFKETKIVKN